MSVPVKGQQPPSGLAETTPMWLRNVPAITWLVFVFALLVLAGGFVAMAFIAKSADAGAIAALATAVLGVVGTHAGHVAGHQLALNSADSNAPDDGKPAQGVAS